MRLADLFRARDVSRIESLRLAARQAVEGLAVGRHRSPHKGSSVEFKEHRPYVPGDELKNIDWKAFGKSDRLYVREFEEETNLRCMLLVDQSGSMAYGGERARSLSREAQTSAAGASDSAAPWWNGTKQEYAMGLAAALSYLMLSNQDSVGVMTFDAKVRDVVPPRMLPSHLNVILNALVQDHRGGETDLGTVLRQASVKLPRRGLVVLISDGFGDVESLGRSLTLLRGGRQDVVFLQVVDPDELDFPFEERVDFRDLEATDRHEIIDARQIRDRYLESLKRHNDMIAAACRRNHVDHLLIRTDLSLVDCLSRFVRMRQAGPVSGAAHEAIQGGPSVEVGP
ncbi:DUF58 domain-containing protein [Allorhodopirellula solitaria]|uniref:VWA domain containing CoxE-like protein n=1 Tax=Allorhodopirellula solitaria TaxID=2527987 RepID=A0A5C5XXL7_9BACT|nr:DUF58 domain-containing protein [Allorhodopirellula solitaria]TWT67299.1 VWA domain containing CoxE-like protein [Allorhodopirellula solitaria]